jgi:ferric-dicitrate binding protein FerR (iron transport regulator)
LNAGSKLAFPDRFSGSKREVFLEGEAYFDVTPEKGFPFFVRTKEVIIKVLGTKFNLSAYEADKEVMTVLVEGKVSLRENRGIGLFGDEIILNRSESALFNKSDFSTKVSHVEQTENYTAWTEGWFPFSKEPLENVFKKIERYYNVRFVYNNLFPSGDLISGKLDLKESIDEVMKVLADVAKIKYRIEKESIYIELNNTLPMRK